MTSTADERRELSQLADRDAQRSSSVTVHTRANAAGRFVPERGYWQTIAERWRLHRPQRLWRAHSDATNVAMCRAWWPDAPVTRVLKTDLFDEAVGDGLVTFLRTRAASVYAIDQSVSVARASSVAGEAGSAIAADVRRLPFADDSFDLIVSNSTLDHFPEAADIARSLTELHRVLAPGGALILTIDNIANPVVAIRNALPFRWLQWSRVVPYCVGATVGPAEGVRLLDAAGFQVAEMTALVHCPRALCVAGAWVCDRLGVDSISREFLRLARSFEGLARWPTRYQTGYFTAFLARKRSRP